MNINNSETNQTETDSFVVGLEEENEKFDNDYNAESSLPVFTNSDSDKVERELILKQLLFLRQDVNDLKQILLRNV